MSRLLPLAAFCAWPCNRVAVPVPVGSRLLGHSNLRMTLRCAHLADRDIEAAAERVGETIDALMGPDTQVHPLDVSNGGLSG